MLQASQLKKKEFEFLKEYIYNNIGISLSEQKIYLVQGRLNKRLKQLNLSSFSEYCELLQNDVMHKELSYLATLISTNVTSFFREESQWKFLEKNFDEIFVNKTVRIWSAASSTGEEPYSINMFLHEHITDMHGWDIKILATDISTKVLSQAQKGLYSKKAVEKLDKRYQIKYFVKKNRNSEVYEMSPLMKQNIKFRLFNLVTGDYKIFKNKKFDIIFCRNVMIYFDKATQNALVSKFYELLNPGGYLFIGSSEALTDIKKGFKVASASIYKKV